MSDPELPKPLRSHKTYDFLRALRLFSMECLFEALKRYLTHVGGKLFSNTMHQIRIKYYSSIRNHAVTMSHLHINQVTDANFLVQESSLDQRLVVSNGGIRTFRFKNLPWMRPGVQIHRMHVLNMDNL